MAFSREFLPTGKHWGLTIVSPAGTQTGTYNGGNWKGVLHTTEGSDFYTMDRVLRQKGAEPHFLIDPASGRVKQYMSLFRFAKALEHPAGTPETNRAHCVQIEICGFASKSHDWPTSYYDRIAALAVLIEHRVDINRRLARRFTNNERFTPSGFLRVNGWLGHKHVPSQPSGHWDPGNFKGSYFIDRMSAMERKY